MRLFCYYLFLIFFAAIGLPAQAGAADKGSDLLIRANTAYNESQFTYASSLYRQAEQIFLSSKQQDQLAYTRHQLAFSLAAENKYQLALVPLKQNLEHHTRLKDNVSQSHYLLYLGQALLQLNRPREAIAYLAQNNSLQNTDMTRYAENQYVLIRSWIRADEPEQAEAVLRQTHLQLPTDFNREKLEELAFLLDIELYPSPWMTQFRFLLVMLCLSVLLTLCLRSNISFVVRAREFSLLSTSVIAAVVLLETILSLTNPVTVVRHLLHQPNQKTAFQAAPGVMPGKTQLQTTFTINGAGLRADPIPDTGLRIIAIGGSSTEALFLDDETAWPQRAQHILQEKTGKQIWIANAGKSGLNTFSHRVQTNYYLRELSPDYILIKAGINDLNQCISGGRQAIIDNSERSHWPEYNADYRKHVFHTILPVHDSQKSGEKQLVRYLKQLIIPDTNNTASAFEHVVQDSAGAFYINQRKRRQMAAKLDKKPDISECLEAFRQNLSYIVELSQQAGAVPVLITQGSLYKAEMKPEEEALLWFGSVDENPFAATAPKQYYTSNVMYRLLQQYNSITLRLCDSYQIECINTDQHLESSIASYYDDVHLNESGSLKLAEVVATTLEQLISK